MTVNSIGGKEELHTVYNIYSREEEREEETRLRVPYTVGKKKEKKKQDYQKEIIPNHTPLCII